jgi:hypothetical protein
VAVHFEVKEEEKEEERPSSVAVIDHLARDGGKEGGIEGGLGAERREREGGREGTSLVPRLSGAVTFPCVS